VSVEAAGATWNNGTPEKLLDARYYTNGGASGGRTYDVSPDEQRFLMIKALGSDAGAAPHDDHRRAALGRGAEAPRADEVMQAHPFRP
jgi:hypothetical protein